MDRCLRCPERIMRAALFAATLTGATCAALPASADEPDDVAALRARVEALEKRADDQQRRLDALPPVRVSGYAQVDFTVLDQQSQDEINWSTGQPLNNDRFTLRRGHVRVESEQGLVSGALEIDANTVNGPQVRPIDAEVRIGWPGPKPQPGRPWFDGTLGLMKIPFRSEVQELDNVRPFLERGSVLRALFPGEF